MSVKTVGVVGGGIGGLGAAWLLDARYEVTLLERNAYVGGHSNTLEVADARGAFPVDTGFMVFNRRNYPLLTALFTHLKIPTYPTSMSFAASLDEGRLEYGGDNLNTLFGTRSSLFDWRHLRMLGEILRFNAAAKTYLRGDSAGAEVSLGDFLERGGYSERFASHYLLPMGAAIWSCPTMEMRAFPFRSFARFFANHGLLDLIDRPDWETVRGGSRTYVRAMLEGMRGRCLTAAEVRRVRRSERQVEVETTTGERLQFDTVVLGCHGDEALALIDSPSDAERDILGGFRYQTNRVFLHEDPGLMPSRRRVWSSWNYIQQPVEGPEPSVTVTYWMNSLQDLPRDRDLFVSLNPRIPPRRDRVLAELTYEHPLFDGRAIESQRRIGEIQGRDRLWFSGAYLGFGFHEDGLRAAVEVARGLDVRPPWERAAVPQAQAVGRRSGPDPVAVTQS